MEVEEDADGLRLIEHNCPFLNVAQHHPALCSVTINTLSRLLGVRVVREERFQTGNGLCAFRILADQPLASRPGPRDGKRGAVEFFSRLSFLTDRPPLDILPVPCIQ